jgi:hypothetical protein
MPTTENKKLIRSKTVTVKLDKKLRFAMELAARSRRLTISSYIEYALKEYLITCAQTNNEFETVMEISQILTDIKIDELTQLQRIKKVVHDWIRDLKITYQKNLENSGDNDGKKTDG